MVINITTTDEISKLLAFLRACAKGTFDINPTLLDNCIKAVARFAKETGLTIDIIAPTGERIAVVASGGMLVGAAAGGLIAGVPGALLGAVAGGLAGYAAAYVTIRVSCSAQLGGPARLHIV